MGGMSPEHDVSIKSGENVLKHLNQDRYHVHKCLITRNGEWQFDGESEYLDVADAAVRLRQLHPDCVFIALHGPFGEDGRIQGMLDMLGIPYTGSGCAASAIAIDKRRAKTLVKATGVTVADHIEFTHGQWDADRKGLSGRVREEIGFPCVVKSPRQGSSLGMGIPQTLDEFPAVVDHVFGFGYRAMVERFVSGIELTCAVLDVAEIERPRALPVTEIRPVSGKFFDYHAKYTPKASEEITPAKVPDAIRDRAQEIAVRAHETVGCRGFSRSDMILSGDQLVWLEVNTVPGLTETSLFPQAAQADGIALPELFDLLIDAAMA